jgi:hypothetical protein
VLADADVPVVAGAVVRVAGLPAGPLRRSPTDFGWTAATPPVTGNAPAALPRPVGPAPVGVGPVGVGPVGVRPVPAGSILLLTTADRGAAVVVRQAGPRGEPLGARTVHVAAHRTAMVALLPAAAAVTLQLDGGQQAWAGVAVAARDPAGPLLTLLAVGPPVAAQAAAVAAVADPWLTGKPATGPVRVGSAR